MPVEYKLHSLKLEPENGNHVFSYMIIYRMRTIITHSLYTFYRIFEGQNCFLKSFFCKILTLCKVSIQEQFQIKSKL